MGHNQSPKKPAFDPGDVRPPLEAPKKKNPFAGPERVVGEREHDVWARAFACKYATPNADAAACAKLADAALVEFRKRVT